MKCVKDIESKRFHCLKKCEGLQVTSFDAMEPASELKNITKELSKDYQRFKGMAKILEGMILKSTFCNSKFIKLS